MNKDELHDLVMQLKDAITAGEIKIADARVLASLARVRLKADGKVDPATVDGLVRATALAAFATRAEREMKKIPLRESQVQYFDILEQFFGAPFSEMKKHDVSPAQISEHMASQERMVQAFQSNVDEFESGMHEFWEYYGPVVELHLRDLKCLKSVFGGDVFPSYAANIACSVGLYMDTVVLPDPLLRILTLAKVMPPKESFRLITKHALSAMGYRELALADVEPPIVVVVPDPMFLEPSYRAGLQVIANDDVLKHASAMFGHKFSKMEQLQSFLEKLSNPDELVGKLADPKRLLFDSEWSEPPGKQFARYIQEMKIQAPAFIGTSIGEAVHGAFLGRMMQTNDLLLRSARYSGTPLIDAPTSWQYLLWKYEYDSQPQDGSQKETIIARAIATEGSTEFGMLSGIPPEALIDLRRNGAMASLRETIRTGLHDIDLASPESLSKVADEVVSTIDRTFEDHDRQLRDISSSRRKFFGFDVSRWIVTGGLSVAAALTQNVGLAVAAATSSLLGQPSPMDLKRQWKELEKRSQTLQRSPAAILFRHLGKRFGF
jgi:hypothetical protein